MVGSHSMLRRLPRLLGDRDDFVVKPNRGSAGRGVLVLIGRDGERLPAPQRRAARAWSRCASTSPTSCPACTRWAAGPTRPSCSSASGCTRPSRPITYKGIPDMRVILYRNEPAMAMLRLPTKESNGRANLHQGGIGTGVDLDTGVTHHAVQRNRFVERHPDTGVPVVGMHVPYWDEVLDMSRRVAEAVGLGYIGVDIVVDAGSGPMLLEANARPGLAIQIANGRGLVPRLRAIDASKETAPQRRAVGETLGSQAGSSRRRPRA